MDLYMAGSTFKGLDEWLQEKGYNKLLSQENDRRIIATWIEAKRKGQASNSKLFIDSGAFSAHTKGIEIDVDEYIEYLNENDDAFTIYAQVDKIPGRFGQPKTREEKLEAPRISWENYLYMVERLKSPKKLLPVFHQGEDFKWLHNILEYRDKNGEPIEYMGVSPANDVSTVLKDKWLRSVYDIITRSSNPNIKTHALGMTSLKVLEKYPFTSADSTSWIMTAVNGSIFSDYGTILVSDVSKNNPSHYNFLHPTAKQTILDFISKHGFTMEQLSTDYKQRELYNITYLMDWASKYKVKPTSWKISKLF